MNKRAADMTAEELSQWQETLTKKWVEEAWPLNMGWSDFLVGLAYELAQERDYLQAQLELAELDGPL